MFNKPRLLDQVRAEIRKRRYNNQTEKQNVGWTRRFVRHHGRPFQLAGIAARGPSIDHAYTACCGADY